MFFPLAWQASGVRELRGDVLHESDLRAEGSNTFITTSKLREEQLST